jgi:DNA-binding transcriptional regulator YiaG
MTARRGRRSHAAPSPTPDAVRRAREDAELTQTAAAALVYCTLRGWQDWESGARRMHPAMWELFEFKRPRRHARVVR